MAAITYKHHGLQPFRVEVRLDGKRVGNIHRDERGYFYRPNAGNEGERFDTIEAVKASIEGTD